MTRFARAKGSKASNEKLPEDSTPWGELRQQILNKQNPDGESVESEDEANTEEVNQEGPAEAAETEPEERVWADIACIEDNDASKTGDDFSDFLVDDGTTSSSPNASILFVNRSQNSEARDIKPSINNPSNFKKNERSVTKHGSEDRISNFKKPDKNGIISRGNDLSYTMLLNGEVTKIVNFEGFNIKEVDALRLYELRKKLYQEKKIPNSEVVRTIQLERRKAEKTLQREMKNVCYNCRKSGHFVSDCPEYKNLINQPAIETGICYKCGSTEHTSHECRLKHANFRFAKCFICNEQGHISRECPDNPRGIYPKGGACKGCGDVTHFAKDCPVLVKQKERKPFTLGTLNNSEIEALDDNFNSGSAQRRNDQKRKHSGMKSFYRQKRFKKHSY